MLNHFLDITPDIIFEAAESGGGRATGRFLQLNAMENRVYDVEMEDDTRVIVKFYRPGRWDRETIQTEHDFLAKSFADEIPVVCPVTLKNGQTLSEIKGVLFTLFPKKQGRLEPELNPAQLQRLGRYLARLHNVGSTFGNSKRIRMDIETYGVASLKTLRESEFVPKGVGDRYFEVVERILGSIATIFNPSALSQKEFFVIHGDCHGGNILWRGDEPFFIDFDDMLYGPPVQDMWMLMGAGDSYGYKNLAIILEAYEALRPFDWDTLRWIESLRTLRMMYFPAWIARRYYDGAFKNAFPDFTREKFWYQEIESMSQQQEKLRNNESITQKTMQILQGIDTDADEDSVNGNY